MPRKPAPPAKVKPAPRPTQVAKAPAAEPEIIEDGYYAGMLTSEVLMAHADQIGDVVGDLPLDGVHGVTDIHLKTLMEVSAHARGPLYAHACAVKYGETLLPYLTDPAVAAETYAELTKRVGHKDDERDERDEGET